MITNTIHTLGEVIFAHIQWCGLINKYSQYPKNSIVQKCEQIVNNKKNSLKTIDNLNNVCYNLITENKERGNKQWRTSLRDTEK